MGQKDLAAKQFESSPEVFADIINALVFEGEQTVYPKDLQPAPTESLYPAITLVLYWGDTAWNGSIDLLRFFRRKKIHHMAKKYINNVCLHMYSMKCLPVEIRQRFKSDMRLVVDYLAEGRAYEPADQEITDVEGTMRMLYELTGDADFINNIGTMQEYQKKGGRVTMCEVVDKFVQRGRTQGIKEGMQEEKIRIATAFVRETIMQKQSKEYIISMLQNCFRLKEEEADHLYREGYEREYEAEIPAFT